MANAYVQTYKSVKIYLDDDDGYNGNSGNESFGYCDDIVDLKAEIDDYMTGPDDSRARQAIGW